MNTLDRVSSNAARETIARFSQDEETGIIKIISRKQATITVLIQNGKIAHGYLNNNGYQRRILKEELSELLDPDGEYAITFAPKPSEVLLFQKVLLEHQGQVEEKPLLTSQLPSLIRSSKLHQNATLQHIRWHNAEAFVIHAGDELSYWKAIFFTDDMFVNTSDTLQQIFDWHEPECTTTTYEGNIENSSWLEIYLNSLFEWACNHILEQYGYLTGRVMINSVIRSLLVKAANEGWKITATDGRVLDYTIFASPAEAGNAYQAMLRSIYKYIEPIIGPVLVFSIQNQLENLCKGNHLSVARMYELFS